MTRVRGYAHETNLLEYNLQTRVPGVAFAKDVYEVPPRNITVAFEKPFNTTASALGLPGDRCAYYGLPPGCTIFWDDGTCEDMESITREVFEAGIARGQAIRAGTATP